MSSYYSRHEQQLRKRVTQAEIPAERIKEAMLYTLFPGGKRFRPMLVYYCGELFNTPLDCLDLIAVSTELMHTFSLIHDDLPAMDNDDFRRGRPSCHRAFDEATAILAGDGMQAFAIELLLKELPALLSPSQTITIAHELLHACGPSGMVSGQSLDMTELTTQSIDEPALRQIHLLKTGQLISACVNMVIHASTPSVTTTPEIWQTKIKALQQFAWHLGLLFQMQDDYLDCYGSEDTLGKGRSSDVANQKQTFATLYEKHALAKKIGQHLEEAQHALLAFGEKANALQTLLKDLIKKHEYLYV